MFNIKKKLYAKRSSLLYQEGIFKGEIVSIENEVFDRLDNVFIAGIPVSLLLKYNQPIPGFQPGQCYERSLLLAMGLDDAILVRGNNTDLLYRFGEENAGHGWVEKDGWVYDPTLLKKIKKERYYNIYKPYDIEYIDPSYYQNTDVYKDIISTTIDDLREDGSKRFWLASTIPPLQEVIRRTNNTEFQEQLDAHLKRINYDYDEISSSLKKAVSR